VGGVEVPPTKAFGWAASFGVVQGGQGRLFFDTPTTRSLQLTGELVLWVVAASLLVVVRRKDDRRRREAASTVGSAGSPGSEHDLPPTDEGFDASVGSSSDSVFDADEVWSDG
jgi:hypothetical protein